MRKHIAFLLITLTAGLLAACGGNSNTSTLVATSNSGISQAEITSTVSGKTLYFASSASPTSISYEFVATGVLKKNGSVDGNWTFANGVITLTPASGTMNLARIQTESQYWLVYDTASNKTGRLYISGVAANADTYLSSIFNALNAPDPGTPANTNYLMGGSIQWLVNPETDYTTKALTPLNLSGVGFIRPYAITTDRSGNFYVTDRTTSNTVKKIDTSGAATQIASGFNNPTGITFDGTYLYVVDSGTHVIYRMGTDGSGLAIIAGTSGTAGDADATGTAAQFNTPVGITNDGTNLYVADYNDHTIRKIQISTWIVTTIAGYPYSAATTDGYGTAARFNGPGQITTDGSNLFVTEFLGRTVRKIVIATGQVTTLAGSGVYAAGDGLGTLASFYDPNGITTDGKYLYVTDYNRPYSSAVVPTISQVRRVAITNGYVKTVWSTGLITPTGITTTGTGLFITDTDSTATKQLK